jgi:hypothetical protein
MRTAWTVIAVLLASTRAIPALAEGADATALTYSGWCGGDNCFVSESSRISSIWCWPRVRAVLTTRRGEAAQTLQITLPPDVDTSRGLELRIDRGAAIERPYTVCTATSGCEAEISGADLVDRLEHGHILVAEAVDAGHSPVAFSLPLDGFAAAYDGPPLAKFKLFENQPGQLAKALQEQKQPRAPTPRITWCGTR